MTRLAGCGVCLIGPGLGRGNGVAAVVRHLLGEIHLPVVLDADGINALEGHIDVLDSRRGLHTVLTPHDGEFVRLGRAVVGRPPGGARLCRGARLLPGAQGTPHHHRLPDGSAYINTNGNPGMAKGSGDVLAGLILSAGPGPACPAGGAHGGVAPRRGGEVCARAIGEYGMTPTDVIAALPAVIEEHVS